MAARPFVNQRKDVGFRPVFQPVLLNIPKFGQYLWTNSLKVNVSRQEEGASMILTIASDNLPGNIAVGCNVCNVRAFIPIPMHCYNCHGYGHSSAR